MEQAIYLKMNRSEGWALLNLHVWMKIGYTLGYPMYVVCDKEEVINKINTLEFASEVTVIGSRTDRELDRMVHAIAIPSWEKAAYAHLTTFVDAWERGYRSIWNIDADDTFFCVSVDKAVEIFRRVEEHCSFFEEVCFSLDMWYSKTHRKYWSFGITFISDLHKWNILIHEHCDKEKWNSEFGNVDNYFGYLKDLHVGNIGLWYCENLVFFHQGNDVIRNLIGSGIYHYQNGRIEFPITKAFSSISEIASCDIADEVVKIDVDINDEDASDSLLYYTKDQHLLYWFGRTDWGNVEGTKIANHRIQRYAMNLFHTDEKCKIAVFGCGKMFQRMIPYIDNVCDVFCVSDNNEKLWGEKIVGKYRCISPEELKEIDNVIVLILVESATITQEIAAQLKGMGIYCLSYMEWCKIAFRDYGGNR